MAKINILPSSVFNRIAAGEVVDRPYSVVKELVENAIDAGSTEIEIRIEQGGKSYIGVQDNGEGIDFADLNSLFLPHATSKISTADDLENIRTLGFRGEAVSSIASVSHMTYTTQKEGSPCYKISCNGGFTSSPSQVSEGQKGTKVEVKDLFFNTPVRLKFLKSDRAEESDITTFVNRFILSHPEISFVYYADDKLIAQSFGGTSDEVLASVYGASILANTIHIQALKNGIFLEGYISNQNFFKPNKSYQSVFVNGRFIVNNTISQAVAAAYKSYVMKRQYPFYVLHVSVPAEIVDVNVHPNKADVRFADNNVIFGTIYSILSDVLDGKPSALQYVISTEQAETVQESAKQISISLPLEKIEGKNDNIVEEKSKSPSSAEKIPYTIPTKQPYGIEKQKTEVPFPEVTSNSDDKFLPREQYLEAVKKADLHDWRTYPPPKVTPPKKVKALKEYSDLYFAPNDMSLKSEITDDAFKENKKLLQNAEKGKNKQTKIDVDKVEFKGNLFNTFLLYELGDTVYIIDQHAAHERLIFNHLNEQIAKRKVVVQPMLLPYTLKVSPSEDVFLYDCLPLLNEIGFSIEETAMNLYTVTAIPLDLSDISLKDFFIDFLSNIDNLQKIKLESILKDRLAMMACKAAVKGGMSLTNQEVKSLIEDMQGDITLKCPHGRPVVVPMTKTELEKMFKRIV